MLTIICNPHGFHVVTILLQGAWFNAPTFTDQNFVPLVAKFFPHRWNPGQRKLVVHIDKSHHHNGDFGRLNTFRSAFLYHHDKNGL
jgi:hypothetical protein